MAGLVGALQALGATRQRDGSWVVDCGALQLGSLFGGDLTGQAMGVVAGEAITFKSPPELAACGKVWMTDVADEDAFCQALGVALDELREQVRGALQTLRRLGCKARLQAPDPRARGTLTRADRVVGVVIDAGGDLIVDEVDGEALPTDRQASMMAPDEATTAEFLQLVDGVLAGLEGLEATGVAAAPSLSKEELRELQAALDDDDDDDDSEDGDAAGFDDSDDDERTAAGVPMPVPSRPRPPAPVRDDVDDDAPGTLEIKAGNVATMPLPRPGAHAAFDDDDEDVEPPTATLTTPIAKPTLAPAVAPPRPAVVTRAAAVADVADDDDDPFDGIGEPTATRPVDLRPTAVPPSDGGLLYAFDDDSDIGNAEDDVDVDVAVDVDDDGAFAASPTSVQAQTTPPAPVSPSPAAAAAHPAIAGRDDDDFEESTAALPHGNGDEDFDDGKTRALVVDEALLARLKRGDDAEKAAPMPARATPTPSSPPAPPPPTLPLQAVPRPGDDDDGFEVDMPATSAVGALRVETRAEDEGASMPVPPPVEDDSSIASAFADDFDASAAGFESDDDLPADDEVTLTPPRPEPPVQVQAQAQLPTLALPVVQVQAPAPATPVQATGPFDEDDQELHELEMRAAALEAELATIRSRIKALRAAIEPTGTATAPAPPATATTAQLRPAPAEQPRVGDSDEGEGETAAGAGLTSLPSLQSIDVHEIQAPRSARAQAPTGNSLLDAFDDDDGPAGDASGFDDHDDDAPAAAPAPAPVERSDEDVVSLAALQGALKELGVLGEGGGETQVAASVMNFAPADDDGGDVFGSGPGGDSLAEARPASDLSVEATRIRTSRPSSIALVVEDERARDRLKKHLADRFSALIEASDGESAMGLRGIGDVDAIVFVRPRRDGGTLASFSRLEHLPQRPRVLVISADDAFDDVPAVDLRLPLGQRASEVARQVLDGLEQLGVPLMPAA